MGRKIGRVEEREGVDEKREGGREREEVRQVKRKREGGAEGERVGRKEREIERHSDRQTGR